MRWLSIGQPTDTGGASPMSSDQRTAKLAEHDYASRAPTPPVVRTRAVLERDLVAQSQRNGPQMTTKGTRPPRRAAAAALVLALLGLFGVGVAVGFWTNNTRLAHTTFPESAAPTDEPAADMSDGAMPDVRGLTEDVARQILADSGRAGAPVEAVNRPYAGLPGIVIEQQPAFGTLAAEAVTLTISGPAAVPDAAGRTEAEIRSQLLELGTQMTVVRRYSPEIAPGTVLGIEPAAGSQLPDMVTVTVADPPASAYLADVSASKDRCSTGSYTQAGAKQDNAMSCSVSERPSDEPRGPMWEFAGAVDEIELAFGLPVDAKPGSSVRVELLVDGKPSGTVDVAYGSTQKWAAAIPGALQFMIVLTATSGEPDDITVTGSVRGSQDAVVTLTEER